MRGQGAARDLTEEHIINNLLVFSLVVLVIQALEQSHLVVLDETLLELGKLSLLQDIDGPRIDKWRPVRVFEDVTL